MRINELARELEVKSGAVIDALAEMGVEGKKTHSSKLDPDEVERVKRHFGGSAAAPASKSAGKAVSKADEQKPKFDFSKISKPGDALKAITKKSPVAPEPPAIAKPIPSALAGAPPKAGVAIPKSAVTGPILPPTLRPTADKAKIEEKPVVKPAAVAPPVAKSEEPVEVAAVPAVEAPVETRPAEPVPLVPPVRRVIMPHSGPRPVYTSTTPVAQPPRAPSGIPERGKPIFQRARPMAPGAPSGRPGSGAGVKRPMHPTSPMRGGMRPPGGGLGLPPPPGAARPGARPAGRRPGGRYVERGTKEGPMKGFVPPRSSAAMYAEPLPITKQITITEGISVKDLAEKLEIRAKDLIARLLVRGVFATVNQTLDSELAKEMARHFGAETDVITFEEQVQQDVEAEMGPAVEMEYATEGGQRPPVVTIMGHVDHGKTSLLDAIRETEVAAGEAGGITQHIGAYKVRINKPDSPANGREITFLDTPGHEAFTRMRARGAKVTDIVVLVVAADDGVMPQTLEAIDHATAAKVPIIVAVNKIDKPEAMPDRVKKQLGDRGLLPEEWGGTTVFVDVSAKKKINLDLLLEMICLVADIQKLKASPERTATGSVVEAKLDRGRGAVATILVQNGTLKVGDTFIVGNTFGKVRAMYDDRGQSVIEAGPSTPVEVQGLEGLPTSGDQLLVLADRDKAKTIAGYREQRAREAMLAKSSRLSLEGLAEQIKTAGMKELPIILKGDVQGSVEVLADTLNKLSNDQVKIKVLHTGAGAITETDVLLASASNAIIIGFNVRPERKAQELAEQEQVDIRLHSIIYELQDEIRKAMTGLLEPVYKETYMGRAEVRNLFKVPKVGTVAGCAVTDGVIKRDSEVRLVRNGVVVFKGKLGSLKRFKDDASEVRNGMECGISIANYNDEKVGDVMECFSVEKFAGELNAVKVMAER